jgi:L-lactate dehydrogenase complex protein LldE
VPPAHSRSTIFVQVGLFITCLNDTFYPRVGAAVVAVLRHFGCGVRFPEAQTCCGQPAYNNGLADEATGFVLRLARLFEADEFVVSPSASCNAMLKLHGPELFDERGAERAIVERLAAKLYDFGGFLAEVLEIDTAQYADALNGTRATYHYPCHSRGLTPCQEATDRAHKLAGNGFIELERSDQCCGFGGAFAPEFSDISGAMLEDKIACIDDTHAHLVICDEAGCRMNISGGLHRRGRNVRIVHTAELIAEALGLELPEAS